MKLHNTLTRSLETFAPLRDNTVTLYTCGPTVYSEPLIGNWVAYIRWDLLVRTLRFNGYKTNRVMNITDVGHLTSDADEGEDKMQKGARREGITEWEVAERYTNRFLEGMSALNLLPPEHITRATEHIPAQIELIQRLEQGGYTYQLDDGVYFDTAKFSRYAQFAKLDLAAQRAGARVDFHADKHGTADFVLWRLTPKGEARNMEWDSPWGKGIPGWHIECSAMAMHYLGETIDIHTGGIDHIPVHHTNEIAQAEAASGKQFARFWLHANFLLSEGTKISKSLQNGYTLDDLRTHGFSPLDFKLFVLQSHYRTESNFTYDNLNASANRLKRWYDVAAVRWQTKASTHTSPADDFASTKTAVMDVLDDDLNSPRALAAIDAAFDRIESSDASQLDGSVLKHFLSFVDDTFGLCLLDKTPDVSGHIKTLLSERERARQKKNWQRSDEIRDELEAKNIAVSDTTAGTRWSYRTIS